MYFLKLRPFFEDNKDRLCWDWVSFNPNAVALLEQNQDKIDWEALSQNPNAIHLLEQNQDKIDWEWLSGNPKAIPLLEKNPDKIDWYYLSGNPSIFTYNYRAMKDHIYDSGLCEELMMKMFHPDNIRNGKVSDWGFRDMMPDSFED